MLTNDVKALSRRLGADLVGIAPAERWAKAPIEHSPRGILPTCRSAIVCAVKIPDACIELGANEDPRVPGPARILGHVSGTLEYVAVRVAKYLEDQGWPSIAIPQSVYWNYRPSPGAPRGWMPDISHYYAAAAAGLGEIGWHNLCITPEYGPRQRFVTILTEADLRPDPLYSGPPLCDRCKLCAKHCPTKSFDKEVDGMLTIEIEDKKYTFPNRNLWRCGIGENFGLDVFLPWEGKVDEKAILETMDEAAANHPEWIFGWKMGMCIKQCMNPQRRYFDKSYTRSVRRKRDVTATPTPSLLRQIGSEIGLIGREAHADAVITVNGAELLSAGIDLKAKLPDAEAAVLVCVGVPGNTATGSHVRAALRMSIHLETYGFSALLQSGIPPEDVAVACGVARKAEDGKAVTDAFGRKQAWDLLITSAPLESNGVKLAKQPALKSRSAVSLTALLRASAVTYGADLVGVAPAKRVDDLLDAVRKAEVNDDAYFTVKVNPKLVTQAEKIWGKQQRIKHKTFDIDEAPLRIRTTADYLDGALSVIVVGVHLPFASVDWAGKGPGRKAGHYASGVHAQSTGQLGEAVFAVAKILERFGYTSVMTMDLSGLSSETYDGGRFDLTANRFAAVAAGVGEIGWNGLVLTPEFGARQRFAALITDAPLVPDALYSGEPLCRQCRTCVKGCPARALDQCESLSVKVEGKEFQWAKLNRLRCDWAKRYGLLGDEGPKYMGSQTDIPVPDCITKEAVCEAIRGADRIQQVGWYTSIVEHCLTDCPAHCRRSEG